MAKFLVEILINAAGEPQARASFDSVGSSARKSADDVSSASLKSETAIRKLTDAAAKYQTQMADTTKSKNFVADMTALNTKLGEQITAWAHGAEGIATWTRKQKEAALAQQILTAQVRAGVSANSDAGKQIAAQITLYDQLTAKLNKAKAGSTGSGIFSSLLGDIGGATGEGGRLIAELGEGVVSLSEKFEGLVAESGSVTGAIGKMAGSVVEFLPLLAEVAVAAVAVGVVWKGAEFLVDAIKEGMKAQEVINTLNQTLKQNGTTTGLSARQMQEYAESLVSVSGKDDDAIIKAETLLVRFDKLNEQGFKRATVLALDYAATGKDLNSGAEIVGKALAGNTKSFGALADIGIVLDKGQKATLQQMVATGQTAEYQAIVFKLLQDKIGGLAEAHSKTLAGSIEIARTVMTEFKKGIASELIPVIENLTNSLVSSLAPAGSGWKSGWDRIRAIAMSSGHDIGESIGGMVYGVALYYHEWTANADILRADLADVFRAIVDFTLGSAAKIADGLGKIPGIGSQYKIAADQIKSIQSDIDKSLTSTAADARKSANDQISSIAGIVVAIREHRQALEGDDQAHGKLGNSTDAVARKTKDLQSAMDAVRKAIQEYADKVSDLEAKQQHQAGAQQYLIDALSYGLLAYNQANVEQERSKAITDALTETYKLHRAEIEKLTAERDKLTAAGQTAKAAEVQAQIDAETKSYGDQATQIGINAGKIFDLTNAKKLDLAATQETRTLENQLAIDRAKLIDLTTRTSTASHDLAAKLADEKDALALLSPADQLRLSFLRLAIDNTHQLTIEQQAINAEIKQTATVTASVADWQAQRDATLAYGKSIEGILQQYGLLSKASQQLAIDEKVEAAVLQGLTPEKAAQLRKDLEGQQEIINGLHTMQAQIAISEKDYKEFADALAANYSGIFSNFIKTGKISLDDFEKATVDAFASTAGKIISDWLSQWFEAMAEWLAKWIATQAAAKAAQAGLGAASSGTGTGGVGISTSTLGAAASLWQTYGGNFIGNPMTGGGGSSIGGGSGSGLGGAAIWGAIVYAALEWLKTSGTPSATSTINFGGSQGITAGNANANIAGETAREAKHNIAEALEATQQVINAVKGFVTSLGGAVDLAISTADASLQITKKGQGSSTNWIVKTVQGLYVGFGKDVEAAKEFATIQAIKSTPLVGVSPEVQAAIKNSIATTVDDFNANITTAISLVHARLGTVGSEIYDDTTAYEKAKAAALALGLATGDLTKQYDAQVNSIENNILGIDTTISDNLTAIQSYQAGVQEATNTLTAGVQAVLGMSVQAAQAYIAQYQTLLDKYHVVYPTNPGGGIAGHTGSTPGTPTWVDAEGNAADAATQAILAKVGPLKAALKEWESQLNEVPKALTDQQIAGTVFGDLFDKYIKGTALAAKYAQQELDWEKAKLQATFDGYKIQIVALGLWDKYAGLWQDAYNNALAALGAAPGSTQHGDEGAHQIAPTPKPPATGGHGSSTSTGPSIADQQASLRAQIAALQASAIGPLHVALNNLDKQIADFTKAAIAAKLPAIELARGVALLTQQFRDSIKSQADGYVGIGTDFTRQLDETVGFFNELAKLGRNKTGMPDWLVKLLQGKALDQLGVQLTTAIGQFNGLTDPMVAINQQAETLRQNVVAYGQAMGWTADQIQAAIDSINQGANYQRTNAFDSIMDNLFGYLKDDQNFASQAADLKKKEVEIQFSLIEAQLKALNAWDAETQKIFDAAKTAAETISTTVSNIVYPDTSGASGDTYYKNLYTAMENAAQAYRQGIQAFTQSTQAIITNPQLSGLTANQQLDAAKSQYADLVAKAKGGDANALSQLDQVRQTLLNLGRSDFAGGQGYQALYDWVMSQSAGVLANAQQGELNAQQLAAQSITTNASQNTATLATAIYAAAASVAQAIYTAIGGTPHYAEGGIVTRPHLAVLGERGPEAIIPMASPIMRVLNFRAPITPAPAHPSIALAGAGGRLLPFSSTNVDAAGAGAGGAWGGGGGAAHTASDLLMAVSRLADAQGRMAGDIKSIAVSSARTASTNESMHRADRIRTAVSRRTS